MRLAYTVLATLLLLANNAFAADAQNWNDRLAEIRARIDNIDTATLQQRIESGEDFLLIDVRMPDEIEAQGTIDAGQNLAIPRGWLEVQISQHAVDADTPIVLYCGAGLRSSFATDTLLDMGYSNVKNYNAGYIDWKRQGLPTR